MGRGAYDMADGDFTGYEFQVPIFVITHAPPTAVALGENEQLTFTFVTDGPDAAIERAKRAAGDRVVTVVGGASTIQQLLNAGLVDELEVDIAPVFLGAGLRYFDHLDVDGIELEPAGVDTSPGRTHLRFSVRKPLPGEAET
jgi:dihydrofolate reductase